MSRTVFRPVDGILLLDKPSGYSSNQALQDVRRLFRAEKGGHTGALDPLATGLLPLCLGEATKIAGLLLGGRKAYRARIRLGATTDTDDADGLVLRERAVPALEREAVEAALQPFVGRIRQRPPIYSALKQGGEALYVKARRGEAIDVPEREVDVEAVELVDLDGAELTLDVTCGSGTYIRSLARDLGEALGCGGHITALRRTWVDPFRGARSYSLADLQDVAETQGEAALASLLLPVEAGLSHWPTVVVDPDQGRRLGMGQWVQLEEAGLKFLPEGAASVAGPSGPVLVTASAAAPEAGAPVPGSGSDMPAVEPGAPVPGLLAVNVLDPSGRSLGLAELSQTGKVRAKRLFRWASAG
ncbi:MAG: tRNA pseudouridine(55) synthase TruB [Arenimonas sp.]|nr:tRNA pseudouridine(55) synthase TruB [Arenimonas sp.]